MNVKLTDEYFIDTDQFNFILKRIVKLDKNQKNVKYDERICVVGYYPTMESALEKFSAIAIENKLADFDGVIDDYVERMFDMKQEILHEIKKKVV